MARTTGRFGEWPRENWFIPIFGVAERFIYISGQSLTLMTRGAAKPFRLMVHSGVRGKGLRSIFQSGFVYAEMAGCTAVDYL
ncbi:MAG: hypothetical protein A3F83_10595 [Candidatus Glassbacteria bacterium RIFCSPLOWO2_12_FULL_58_11]|uniref:Uncharacterized protein n=1 Tax=Candidatus Glassbacteria bacterium RIFCSPLOWO2_12_FULL_58_11 TaxID=1817867 RepID=A0A1F5YQ77_9BACT|nr:MAG: hypothetical protein A3F83_10595 [Candidatus Glassbacteria bacterium RIFCSPLOWO2_12_FULL_58_11]